MMSCLRPTHNTPPNRHAFSSSSLN
jgi:hypothetical protein